MTTWPVHEAKARFSQLVRDATNEGPQLVTKHGRPAVVVVSSEEYNRRGAPQSSLVELIRSSPMAGVQIDIERDPSGPRDVDLSEVAPWAT